MPYGPTVIFSINTRDMLSPVITKAVSRKSHGIAGDFDIDLINPLQNADIAVECRKDDSMQILVTFNETIQGSESGSLQITDIAVTTTSSIIVVNKLTSSDKTLIVDLSNVSSPDRITIHFPGIADLSGNACYNFLCFGVLYGDSTGDGIVNISDMLEVRDHLNENTNINNFRSDFNLDGKLLMDEMIVVRENMNKKVPNV